MAITINNTATLNYNGNTVSSNTTEGQLLDTLAVSKEADIGGYYGVGDRITYRIGISNTGESAINGVNLSDNLGSYNVGTTPVYPLSYVSGSLRYYVNGVLQSTGLPTITEGPPMSVSDINIPSGGNVLLIYEVLTTAYAPQASGETIENIVTADAGTFASSDTATVNANATTCLTVAKVMSPTTVTDGDTVSYTLVIQNTGNTEAAANSVSVADTLTPPLQEVSVTLDGTPLAETDYSYTSGTGAFSIPTGVITVPAASWTQDTLTGLYSMTPGAIEIIISGTV